MPRLGRGIRQRPVIRRGAADTAPAGGDLTVSGSVTPAGTLARTVSRNFTGSIAPAGGYTTLGGGGGGAITFRGAGAEDSPLGGANTALSPGLPAGTQTGDWMLMLISGNSASGPTAGLGIWASLGAVPLVSSGTGSTIGTLYAYAKRAGAGETAPALTVPSGRWSSQIAGWAGVHATTALDVAVVTLATSIDPPAITPATAGAVVLGLAGLRGTTNGALHVVSSTNGTLRHNAAMLTGGGTNYGVASVEMAPWSAGAVDPNLSDAIALTSPVSATIALRPAPAAGPATYPVSLAGAVTPAGALARTAARSFPGSLTPAGALAALKVTVRNLSGSAAPAGALTRAVSRAVSGSSAPSGLLRRTAARTLTGTASASGALRRTTARALTGSSAPAGTLASSRILSRLLAGSLTPAGTLARSVTRRLTASTAPAGALRRTVTDALTGSITPAGALARTAGKLLSGAITGTGTLIPRRMFKHAGHLGTAAGHTSSTTLVITTLADVAAGSTILVAVTSNGTAVPAVADAAGNAYTVGPSNPVGVSTLAAVARALVTSPLPAGSAITISWGTARTTYAASADHFLGFLDDPLDEVAAGSGTSQAMSTAATAVTEQAGELIYGVFGLLTGSAGTTTITPGDGFTPLTESRTASGTTTNRGVFPEYRVVSATGAYAADASLNISREWTGVVAAFKILSPSAQIIPLAVSGMVTAAGALARTVSKRYTGSSAPAGALQTLKVKLAFLSGTATAAGVLRRTVTRPLAGLSQPSASLTRAITRPITASVTPAGNLIRGKLAARSYAGTITPSGALARMPRKVLAGTSTAAGTLTRQIIRRVTATITPAGTTALTGGLTRSFAGTITAAGTLRRTASRALAGVLPPSGAITRRELRKALGGTVTASGTLRRTLAARLAGILAAAGSLAASVLPRGQLFPAAQLMTRRYAARASMRRYTASARMRGWWSWLMRRS